MSHLFASVFTGFGAFFGGIFGGGHSHVAPIAHPEPNSAWEASTTIPHGAMPMFRNGVFGTVQTINGTTITVDGHQGTSTVATTTYSVDASNAKIIKGSATGTSTASISDISVGDHVVVQGPVSSSDYITATTIIDGRVPMMGGMRGMASSTIMKWNNGASSTPGMRHPTPGTPPPGFNPGGPMIPAGAGANVNVNVGGGY